jgi:5-methyltetrahydrofolate--homocysteine methyltransferase
VGLKAKILKKWEREILLFEGAMGTQLQEAGLEGGIAPEKWNLEKPEIIKGIFKEYLEVGSQVVQTNTFGANRLKLEKYGLEDQVERINKEAVRLAKEVQDDNYISGSVGPLGKFLDPIGNLTFIEATEIFKEQIAALVDGGVDLISIETMSSLQEIRAALIAAKEVSEQVPIIAQMTFDQNLRTLSGSTPKVAAVVLDALGADIIGANCGLGPEGLLEVLKELKSVTNKPLIVQPNAGLPKIVDGETCYLKQPGEMAAYIKDFVKNGANIIGGCCGTTSEHIEAFAKELKGLRPQEVEVPAGFRLASRSELLEKLEQDKALIIGTANDSIKSQIDNGAEVLNINVENESGNIEEEKKMMKQMIEKVQNRSRVPIIIESNDLEVLETGLRSFAGKAIINSVTGEEESLKKVLPLVKKYGAAVICLTSDENGVPKREEDRLKIAQKIKNRAMEYGISPDDLLIDPLFLTKEVETKADLLNIKLVQKESTWFLRR